MSNEIKQTPKEIFDEYKNGVEYKASIGDKGIYEQSKINERFYVGDQWYGAQAGNSRPLVRRNIIKRIGEYKISTIGAAPLAVNYTADGIPDTSDLQDEKKQIEAKLFGGEDVFKSAEISETPKPVEVSVIMSAMSEYFAVTSERLKFNGQCEQMLRNAYISGTGFIYTYWNSEIETGLYVDESQSSVIKGDIACEVLDVENVNLGDPNNNDIQSQPFIIISQRKILGDVKREAKRNHQNIEEIKEDKAETYSVNGGDRGVSEPEDSKRVTVLTKLWKEYDKDGGSYKIYAIRVTENAIIRPKWDVGVSLYPIAKFVWERRKSCAYGDSEVTYLIPNQISINRALTSAVWATMNSGAPKILVNNDMVPGNISNDPGQVVRVNARDNDVAAAIRYLQPPSFAGQFEALINDIASNTLSDSGANDAALGNIRPDNASAIIQMREAALQPMQIYQNRYYEFVEDVARIWADFWIHMYGDRSLKIKDENGTHYMPFHAERYKKLVISTKIDVGASTLWSEAVVISTLDNLLANQLITFEQYLERVPAGIIPDVTRLLADVRQQNQMAAETEYENSQLSDEVLLQQIAAQNPELYQKYVQLPPEQQQAVLTQMRGSMQNANAMPTEQEAMI